MDLYGVIALVIGIFCGGWDFVCYFHAASAREKAEMLEARAAGLELYRQMRKKGAPRSRAAKKPKTVKLDHEQRSDVAKVLRTATLVGIVLAVMAAGNSAQAQTADTVTYTPGYLVAAGVEYNRYNTAGPAMAGWTTFAVEVGQSKVYSWSTIELASTTSTVRTGAGYLFAQSGNWSLVPLGDAGLAVSPVATLGSFSGGGAMFYDIGQRFNKGHLYLSAILRVTSITSNSVQPVFEFGVGKSF
jgi:hypothetical protein